jgi:hypothetical protein
MRAILLIALVAAAGTGCRGPEPAAPARGEQVPADMAQLMRGLLFPTANVVFTAQTADPATITGTGNPSTSPNPLEGTYGGWMAVEHSGLILAESADLLMTPGRVCRGRPTPVADAEWQVFVQELRDAGMVTARAGQAKTEEAVFDAAEKVGTACANCHAVYLETCQRPAS